MSPTFIGLGDIKIAHFVHFIPLYIMTLTKTMYHTKKKISINNIFLEKLRFTFFLREKWLVDFSIRRHRQTSPHMQQISSAEIFFFFKLEIKYTCLEHLYIFIFRLKTRQNLKKKLKSIGVVRVSRSLSRIYIRFEFSMIF